MVRVDINEQLSTKPDKSKKGLQRCTGRSIISIATSTAVSSLALSKDGMLSVGFLCAYTAIASVTRSWL